MTTRAWRCPACGKRYKMPASGVIPDLCSRCSPNQERDPAVFPSSIPGEVPDDAATMTAGPAPIPAPVSTAESFPKRALSPVVVRTKRPPDWAQTLCDIGLAIAMIQTLFCLICLALSFVAAVLVTSFSSVGSESDRSAVLNVWFAVLGCLGAFVVSCTCLAVLKIEEHVASGDTRT